MVFLVPNVLARPRYRMSLPYRLSMETWPAVLLALLALRTGTAGALVLVWIFNLVGTADLLNALRRVDVAQSFGAAWYIPTFLVPLLLVAHFMIFVRLLKRGG